MARPREFDRDAALQTAKAMFWRKGYEAATAEDLRLAMGIGRQSFYDTFGGKRPLYLEVLRQYSSDGVQACLDRVRGARSPLAGLEKLLLSYSKERPQRRALGCMGVSAICEFGTSDRDVVRIGSSSSARLEAVLKGLIHEGKAKGQIRASVDERAAARHLQATILGMKVMSKAGARPAVLRDVALAALRGLEDK